MQNGRRPSLRHSAGGIWQQAALLEKLLHDLRESIRPGRPDTDMVSQALLLSAQVRLPPLAACFWWRAGRSQSLPKALDYGCYQPVLTPFRAFLRARPSIHPTESQRRDASRRLQRENSTRRNCGGVRQGRESGPPRAFQHAADIECRPGCGWRAASRSSGLALHHRW